MKENQPEGKGRNWLIRKLKQTTLYRVYSGDTEELSQIEHIPQNIWARLTQGDEKQRQEAMAEYRELMANRNEPIYKSTLEGINQARMINKDK